MDDLLRDFLTETYEKLSMLDTTIKQLEVDPYSASLLNIAFRLFHTIKGNCRFLGLSKLERIIHAEENILSKLRDKEIRLDRQSIDVFFLSLGRIKSILGHLEQYGIEPDENDEELIAAINAITALGSLNTNLAGNNIQGITIENLVTSEKGETILAGHKQAIGTIWARLPFIVQDLAHQLNKKIDLKLLGSEIALDQSALNLLKECFVLMVRNAADHGIELPQDRLARGKPEVGSIILSASYEEKYIRIEVLDDGAGLVLDKIKAKIVQKGWVLETEVSLISDQEIMNYIFKPGFSTAQSVTTVSGRGVGMDVVRTNIEKMGAIIDIRSEQGRGVCFIIKIPKS